MRGTLPLKVRIPGCEPIRKLSGTHDRKILKKLVRMIHTLHEQGRDDLVNAIARGQLKALQVYTRHRFNRLDELPHADEAVRYADAWPTWLAGLDCSDLHRTAITSYCERLGKLMPADASLTAVVGALKEFRVIHRTHARTFELARNTVAALLRATLGRRHRLYLEVREVPALKQLARRTKHPLTPDQLRDLVRKLGEPDGPMVWTMATTGMGWREYTGRWEREGEGLRIHGTKTGGRDRLIPLVSLLHVPEGTLARFRSRLTKASDGKVTPYDLRRTFAGLMVEAGIPRPRRKSYMGHTADDITALYEWQEVREYLVKDAERIRVVLGEPPEGPAIHLVRGA